MGMGAAVYSYNSSDFGIFCEALQKIVLEAAGMYYIMDRWDCPKGQITWGYG